MIKNVLYIRRAKHAGSEIKTSNFDADAMASAEQVRSGKNFDVVFVDFPRHHGTLRCARERMPRLPWLRPRRVERAVRSLQPSAGQLPRRQVRWDFAFAFPGRANRYI